MVVNQRYQKHLWRSDERVTYSESNSGGQELRRRWLLLGASTEEAPAAVLSSNFSQYLVDARSELRTGALTCQCCNELYILVSDTRTGTHTHTHTLKGTHHDAFCTTSSSWSPSRDLATDLQGLPYLVGHVNLSMMQQDSRLHGPLDLRTDMTLIASLLRLLGILNIGKLVCASIQDLGCVNVPTKRKGPLLGLFWH